jgi:HD-GYP domain-containing protein (c-di-GMP phosphodiesterase class II)
VSRGRLAFSPHLTLAAGATFALLPPAVLHFFGEQQVAWGGWTHFLLVGVTAAAAAAAAIALTIAGARSRDGRTVMVGTAFSVMAGLLVVHGLATPGLLVGMNGVISFSGGATLPVGGALLVLATLPSLRRPRAVGLLVALQVVLAAGIVTLGVVGMLVPSSVPDVPEPRSNAAFAALFAGLALYGLVGYRALRTLLLTRRAADVAVFVGIVWLAAALVAALTLSYLDLGWWIGHVLEVVGIAIVGVPVAFDLHRSAQSRPLLGDLRAAELVMAEEAYLGSQVRALTVSLADKDVSTEEHTRRVALRAVQVGEELRLPPARLRTLAVGGLLHDMGKLSVPKEILGKPGSLTDEEYDVIKRHPEWGDQLLRELGGFAPGVRMLVLNHHERLDGSGYPRQLHGKQLDLETRILGVCDVYDALVSPRVYRPPWSHAQAMELLRAESGATFDERCVAALERVLERESRASEPTAARRPTTAASSGHPRTDRPPVRPVPAQRPS